MNVETMIAASKGDVSSMDEVFLYCQPLITKLVWKRYRDSNIYRSYIDIEDVCQEVCLGVLSRIKYFDVNKLGEDLNKFILYIIYSSLSLFLARENTSAKSIPIDNYMFLPNEEEKNEYSPKYWIDDTVDSDFFHDELNLEDEVVLGDLKNEIIKKVVFYKSRDWGTYRVFPSNRVSVVNYMSLSQAFLDGHTHSEIGEMFSTNTDFTSNYWRVFSTRFVKDVLSPITLMLLDTDSYYRKYYSEISEKAKKFIIGEKGEVF